MGVVIYTLCALTCLMAAALLLRAYSRGRYRVLFWSGLCFVMLTVSNSLNVIDRITPPDLDFIPARLTTAVIAVALILFGLIWERD
jgi:FtsH-binding integral membrane protein